MLADTRIIARQSAAAGAVEVLAQRHEVLWNDGTSVQLHPVQAHGLPLLGQRAVEIHQHLALVDLTGLVRSLDADLRSHPARDQVDLVFYALRKAYPTAAEFCAAVERKAIGRWWTVADGWVWQPAARRVDAQLLDTASLAIPRCNPLKLMITPGAAC